MSVIGDLRAALRDNLKTLPDLQVSRYALNNPTPPGVHILPPSIRYHQSFGEEEAISDLTFTVQAFVALNNELGPQILLDEMIAPAGDRSVRMAIESDKTLGGLASDLIVSEVSDARWIVTASNQALLIADWTVTVFV